MLVLHKPATCTQTDGLLAHHLQAQMTDHHQVKLVVKPLLAELLRHDFDIDKIDPHKVLPQRTGERLGAIHLNDIIMFGMLIVRLIVKLVAKHKQAHKSIGEELALISDSTLSDPPDAVPQTDSTGPADAKDVVPTQVDDMTATSDYLTPKPVATAFDVLFPAKPNVEE